MKYPALSIFPEIRRDLVIFFTIAVACYLLAVIYGVTYFHPDQHFQTLEWADFKRTGASEEALPWEYERAIRPWLQPYLYVGILNLAEALGITNPFHQDQVIRLITAGFGASSLILFAGTIAWWLPLKGQRRLLIAGLALTALFPHVMTRTSGETLSSIFMMYAFAALFLLRKNPEPVVASDKGQTLPFTGRMNFSTLGLILSGAAIAIAFQFRYQSGPVFVIVALWMLIAAKTPLRQMLLFVATILIVTALGVLVDTVGYGRFELAPYNYVVANIFDGIAKMFGTSPWYFYFVKLSSNPVGGALVVSMVLYAVRFPRNLLALFVVAFFVQHSLIGHKEARFMYPVIPFAVAMIPFLFPATWYRDHGNRVVLFGQGKLGLAAGIVVLGINSVGIYTVVFPSIKSPIVLQRFIINNLPDDFTYYSLGVSAYRAFKDAMADYPLRMEFYAPSTVTHHVLPSIEALQTVAPGQDVIYLHGHTLLPDDPAFDIVRGNCTMLYQTYTAEAVKADPGLLKRDDAMHFQLLRCRF